MSNELKSNVFSGYCFANFLKDNAIFKEAMKEEAIVEKKPVDHCTFSLDLYYM